MILNSWIGTSAPTSLNLSEIFPRRLRGPFYKMEALIILIIFIILGSGLCSMTEAAFFGVSLADAKILAEQKKIGSARLIHLKENMHQLITVIVILNNVFNIVGSIAVGLVAVNVFGSNWMGLFSATFTFLIILFAEIFPKTIGTSYSTPIALYTAGPLTYIIKIFSPIVAFTDFLVKPFSKHKRIVSEEEIKILSQLGHLEGSIEADEKEMIQKVFTLNDLTARDIMTPRTVIKALDGDKTLSEMENEIYTTSHSRFPIYRDDVDNIIGICHQRDLLISLGKDQKKKKISDFAKKGIPIFVPEDIKLDKLLPFFQKEKIHMAVVQDEFGGTSGVVTLEDVLEQIVGEIVDETDKDVDLREKAKQINEG